MDSFNTFTDIRYWSKVLQHTNPILLSDLEVKVIDLENFHFSSTLDVLVSCFKDPVNGFF